MIQVLKTDSLLLEFTISIIDACIFIKMFRFISHIHYQVKINIQVGKCDQGSHRGFLFNVSFKITYTLIS